MNIIEELRWRGIVKELVNEEYINEILNSDKKITVYCGFDPSAPTLQLGNLLQIILLRRFLEAGHNAICLIGGSTGLVGDPSGKMEERELTSIDRLMENADALKKEVSTLLPGAIIVNNYDWTKEIDLFQFLREYGKEFTLSYLLNKESVKRRIENGLSYAEFTYTIFQAIDFLHLYREYGCNMQFGGSEQWGNIASGLDLIKKKEPEAKCAAFITHLLLDENGNKYGKSAGNAIFLNREYTSPYDMYQVLFNTSDATVVEALKWYTFLTEDEIKDLEKQVQEEPHLRAAQKKLAEDVVTYVHGKEAFEEVLKITEALFSGDVKSLNESEINDAFKGVPSIEIAGGVNLLDLLVSVNAASSKREAREFVLNGAVLLNGDKVTDENYIVTKDMGLFDKYVVIRRGKKNYYLVSFK